MRSYGIISFILLFWLAACNSVRLETTYKDPEIVLFHANKLLVVGLTRDEPARVAFESQLQELFEGHGVETVRSIDLFDVEFTESERTEAELDAVEQQLLDKDFDAILFTKLIGSRTHSSLKLKLEELNRSYDEFGEDYLLHQGVYYDRSRYEATTDYFAETSLYCICVGKERNLVWRSEVLISNPRNVPRAIQAYIGLIVEEMGAHQLILGTDMQ